MDKFLIEGGIRLRGTVKVQGSKNATLPILAGALLSKERIILHNVPTTLLDVQQMIGLCLNSGADLSQKENSLHIIADELNNSLIVGKSKKLTRYSLQLAAALLARLGKVRFPLPGGCELGKRKIDLHLEALTSLGAVVTFDNDFVELKGKELSGAVVSFRFPSVGATETFLIAACTAKGISVLVNAAKEPEVVDLANFLISLGANIQFRLERTTSVIEVKGVDCLRGGEYRIIPDRIVTATYIIAAGITQGEILIRGSDIQSRCDCPPKDQRSASRRVSSDYRATPSALLDAVITTLGEIGICIEEQSEGIYVKGAKDFNPVDITTSPYPGLPTDAQPLIAPLLVLANGESNITETIFDGRFRYTEGLIKMGAFIELVGERNASFFGPALLNGAEVTAPDIRGGVSLVLAALVAQGETVIEGIHQIDRGYERLDYALASLGGRIKRI